MGSRGLPRGWALDRKRRGAGRGPPQDHPTPGPSRIAWSSTCAPWAKRMLTPEARHQYPSDHTGLSSADVSQDRGRIWGLTCIFRIESLAARDPSP